MKIKIVSLFVFALLVLCVFSNAQNMDTISYVPVKTGYYDKITTKSVTALAQEVGDVTVKKMKTNSSKFILDTRKLTFGKPVSVKDSVYSQGPAVIAVKNKLLVQGIVQTSGDVKANSAQNVTAIQARELNMPSRKLDVGSGPVYVDGIVIPNPGSSCTVGWKSVTAKNEAGTESTYQLLGCQSGGGGCTCSDGYAPGATKSCGNCGTQTCSSSCTWGACTGGGECSPGATNTGGCPNGQAGYITKTCNSACQWYVSANTCQSGCTPSTTAQGNPTYLSFNEAASADTCDGTPKYQFTCNGPKTCLDTVKMGSCVDNNGTTRTPDWNEGPYKYQTGSGYPTTVSYGSKPSTTCQYSAAQMVLGSSGPYDDAFARSVCMQQCYANGLPYGYGCSTSCIVVGNCWPESNNAGYNCQIYPLTCTAVELKCQTLKYDKVCC
jgi:hypothetical protein